MLSMVYNPHLKLFSFSDGTTRSVEYDRVASAYKYKAYRGMPLNSCRFVIIPKGLTEWTD